MADIYKKFRGFIGSIFRFGNDATDPQIKISGGIPEIRNGDDTAYQILRAATPVGDFDVANKIYVDTLTKPLIVSTQVDTSGSFPNNTAVRRFLVVTTAGNGAVLGDVLYDNGLNDAQPMEILNSGPAEGRTIAVTDTLSGGTISFDADSIYLWDADGSSWVKIGDVGAVTGAVRTIRFTFDYTDQGGTVDSVTQIPANAYVLRTDVNITTPFNGTTPTITVGRATNATLLQVATDNNAEVAAQYQSDEDIAWGGTAGEVRVTVGGSAASAGAGNVVVQYSATNA